MKTVVLAALCGCLIQLNVSAQDRKHDALSHEKRHKLADNMINKGSYYGAIEHLEELVRNHSKNEKYLLRLADAYYLSRDYKNAEVWYGKVVKMQKKISSAMFKYGECLKYNEKYVEARDIFRTFSQSKYSDKKGENFKRLAKNQVLSCEWVLQNPNVDESVKVDHLGDHVNSSYSEFAPIPLDSLLIFSSLQSDTVIRVDSEEPHNFHVKILASRKENDQWGAYEEFPSVNTPYENNANGTFSIDGKRFYFTRCIPDENNKMICSIYMTELNNGIWQKPVKLNDKINQKGFTSTQPGIGLLTASNKKQYEILFFVSDRKGGRGGMDIWYSIVTDKGEVKNPSNAGNRINTTGNEITPFFHTETHTLYFSSDYYFGYGGFDVFASKGTLNQWAAPVNISKPINSSVDDTYYTLNSLGREGFFVSNRPEGYHLTSETCCDDIYKFKIRNPFVLKVETLSLKDSSQANDVHYIVLSKSADSNPLVSMDTTLSDSSSVRTDYNKDAFKDTVLTRAFPDVNIYPELDGQSVLFDLQASHDYLISAVGKYDSSSFLFRTSAAAHEMEAHYSKDTLISYDQKNGAAFDLLSVRFYLHSDSIKPVAVVKQEEEILEDEHSFTVTRFITEVKESKTGRIILNYETNDVKFIEHHTPSLDSLVQVLKEFPELKIAISAHTDDVGPHHYNMELSKKRAHSLEAFLSQRGIDRKRIISKWYGETEPLVPNVNPDGSGNVENRRLNRRTEITIIEE